jgi:AcrR family transcriptional regulator
MPTGVALRDVREQLFDAAERVLLRDGPGGLTSRAVTTEAGCAKGVLHRHFEDFDGFLAELVLDRLARLERQAAALLDAAGAGTVLGNLADAVEAIFGPVAVRIVHLIIARDELRTRLRAAEAARGDRPVGIPILNETAALLADYLGAERELGRLAPDADVDTMGRTVVGAVHLVFAARDEPPEPERVDRVLATVVGGALREPGA